MTVPSTHFEAKKHAYRQTQDGVVISFVVHPNDLNAALAVAPLGTRYMVAVAQIGDDDQPVPPGVKSAGMDSSSIHERSLEVADGPLVAPISTETAVAPGGQTKGGWYGLKPSARAALLCKEPEFWRWASERTGLTLESEKAADAWLKDRIGLFSKADLNPDNSPHNPKALGRFKTIERQYRVARGMETEETTR